MKALRLAALAVALCAGMTSVAAAQAQPEHEKHGQGEMKRGGTGGWLLKDITLTDAQKEQIKTIREKYAPRHLEIRKAVQATGVAPDDATRAKMVELQNQQAAEIRVILTADQQVIFDRNLAEMKARGSARSK
jgi:hypothetical protein